MKIPTIYLAPLALFACVIVSYPAAGRAVDRDDPVILKAQADVPPTQLTIEGVNFGNSTPTVTFNGQPVSVLSHTPTKVVVALPAGTQPGSYELRLTPDGNGNDKAKKDTATFDVTIGGAGPQGPPGPPGARGDTGEQGPRGFKGDQ